MLLMQQIIEAMIIRTINNLREKNIITKMIMMMSTIIS